LAGFIQERDPAATADLAEIVFDDANALHDLRQASSAVP